MASLDQKSSKRSNKWFSNKSLKLSFNRRRSKSNNSASSSSSLSSPDSSQLISQTHSNIEDELRQVFRYFDENNDGKISALELSAYFRSIGEYMSEEEAQAVINDLDGDGDKLIDFQDFLELMKKDVNGDEDLRLAFQMFELERDCLTPKGLQTMLSRLGDKRSYEECKAMIRAFDTDGNGVLDFNEFYRMMA